MIKTLNAYSIAFFTILLAVITFITLLWLTDSKLINNKANITELNIINKNKEITNNINSIRWDDLNNNLFTSSALTEHFKEEIIEASHTTENPVILYLASLFYFSKSDLNNADMLLKRINPLDIPSLYLYFPYRLYQEMYPRLSNPYFKHIKIAVAKNVFTELISARILAQTGNLYDSLKYYLRTDPAKWSDIDANSFRLMMTHNGLKNDAQKLIYSAWKSGRLDNVLSIKLKKIAMNKDISAENVLISRMKHELSSETKIGQLMIATYKDMQETRNYFMNRNYNYLINKNAESDPYQLGDEKIMLLFLSALKLRDINQSLKWGQEIKRRNDDKEINDWVMNLTKILK